MTNSILDDLILDADLPEQEGYFAYARQLVLNEENLIVWFEPEQQIALRLIELGYNEEEHREQVLEYLEEHPDGGSDLAEAVVTAIHYVERDVEEFLAGRGLAVACGFRTGSGFEDPYCDDEFLADDEESYDY
jgi:hypothetical protein